MGAVLPAHLSVPNQPQICLIDERGGLKRVLRPLLPQIPGSHPAQFAVDLRHESIERGAVTLHGAYFGVAKGELSVLDRETGEFRPVGK